MTNCHEFKKWLNDQASADEETIRQVMDHAQVCPTCQKLFNADMALNTILKTRMQPVEPPPGLIGRARHKIDSESRTQPLRFPKISWKTALPAVSMAALVLVILLNPFSGHLQTVDEVVAHSIANHMNASMEMADWAGEVSDIGQWFTQRLGYTVRLPDLKKLGLNLLGGRHCSLGKVDAALLFCNSKGKRASLFVIKPKDIGVRFDKEREYIVKDGDFKVTLWKESGMVYAMVI